MSFELLLERTFNYLDLFCILVIVNCIIFAIGIIAYIIFGIIFLIKDYQIVNNCENSYLWEYVLTAVIIRILSFNINKLKKIEDKIFIFICIIIGLSEACLALWGVYEIENSCNYIKNSNFWKFSLVTIILQIFISFICLIIIPILYYNNDF